MTTTDDFLDRYLERMEREYVARLNGYETWEVTFGVLNFPGGAEITMEIQAMTATLAEQAARDVLKELPAELLAHVDTEVVILKRKVEEVEPE